MKQSKQLERPVGFFVGVDVGKDKLDVCVPEAGDPEGVTAEFSVSNDAKGLGKLRESLPEGGVRVVLEAAGGYERKAVRFLSGEEIPFSPIGPVRIRRFAQAAGRKAKTDRIDALMTARFAAAPDPPPRTRSGRTASFSEASREGAGSRGS